MMCRRLDANFDVDQFEHVAFFNRKLSQIEMHLVAKQDLDVHLKALDLTVKFEEGERLAIDISREIDHESVNEMLSQAGFRLKQLFTSDDNYFALAVSRVEDS